MEAIGRRSLVLAAGPVAGALCAVSCTSAGPTASSDRRTPSPPVPSDATTSAAPAEVALARVQDLAAGPLLVTDPVSGDPAYLVATDDQVTCLSAICTHGGCTVEWSGNKGVFACPCHGGHYGLDGSVVSGPPPRPLPTLAVRVAHGQVYRQA